MDTGNTFTNTGWEERFYTDQNESPRHSTVEAKNAFSGVVSGVVSGEGIVRYAMFYVDDARGQFLGLQTITGTIDGHSGSFTVREEGSWTGASISGTFTVLEKSGTGELTGLTGAGEYSYTASEDPNCSYSFEYQFGNA